MKLTILIMTIFFLQVSASSNAQITLNVKQESLRKVLEKISQQSGYDFVYSDQTLSKAKPVDLKLINVSVERALQAAFEGQPLMYEVSDKTVMVRKKEDKSVIDRVKEYFATITVIGHVYDQRNQPMVGTTVTVKRTSKSVLTSDDGTFVLRNIDENAILVISHIGYVTEEVKANSNMEAIILEINTSKLDEVQVIAYGTTTRRLSTSNITTIKGSEIEKQPINNPLYALQGRVPGLIVTPTSGLPGAPVTLQIHGQNSLGTALTQPLIIIDGVPFENNIPGATYNPTPNGQRDPNISGISALSFVNPSDIESISVLKDGDATSIYGSRGSGGVILITTKKGKIGRTSVDVNVVSGFSNRTTNMKLMNTQQYLEMRKEAFRNDGVDFTTAPYDDPAIQRQMAPDLFVWDQNRYTDWQKEMLGNAALYHDVNASISGGTALIQYRVGGTYHKDGFVFPKGNSENKSEAGMGNFSLTGTSPNQKFKVSLNSSYTGNKSVSPGDYTGAAVILAPNAPALYKSNGELNWEPDPVTGYATWQNPLAALQQVVTQKSSSIRNSAVLSYKVLSSLTFKANLGFTKTEIKGFIPDPIVAHDPALLSIFKGSSVFSNGSSRSWSVEPQALYNTFIAKGKLEVLLGGALQSQNTESQLIKARGYLSDALLADLGSASSFSAVNNSLPYKYGGFFARVNYNLSDKYILNLSGRRDGSSKFGPGKRFGSFGSVGGAWIFTNEDFIKKAVSFMSFGKLRASYGTSGNDNIGYNQYVETYKGLRNVYTDPITFIKFDVPMTYQGLATIKSEGVNNPDYHWESVQKLGVGIDLSFFNERVSLSADYWRTRSSDQLTDYILPATGGNTYITINQPAKIQNMGGDFTLNTVNIQLRNFKWSSSANLSIQRNKLLALPTDGTFGYTSALNEYYARRNESPVGKPFNGVMPVYEYRGVDPATGLYQFADMDGKTVTGTSASHPDDGSFQDANPWAKIVSIAPQYLGGVSNSFTYKGLNLNVFLQFTKQMGRSHIYSDLGGQPGTSNMPMLDNRWQKPGDIGDIQRVSNQGYFFDENFNLYNVGEAFTAAKNSDAAWVDASFIRIKNVDFSYNIPGSWIRKMRLQNVSLNLQMQNLWTFTKYKGADPETQYAYGFAPPRTITAGLRISL